MKKLYKMFWLSILSFGLLFFLDSCLSKECFSNQFELEKNLFTNDELIILKSSFPKNDFANLHWQLLGPMGKILAESDQFFLVTPEAVSCDSLYAISVIKIPFEAISGQYLVEVLNGLEPIFHEQIRVEFIKPCSEKIEMTPKMDKITMTKGEKKATQTHLLRKILMTKDLESLVFNGEFTSPLKSSKPLRITSEYRDIREYLYRKKSQRKSVHHGIDYGVPTGTPVYSSGFGKVVFSGERIVSGKTVIIEHYPSLYSLYYHLSALDVSEGDVVKQGQLIGKVGMTGLATGAHLHYEIRFNAEMCRPVFSPLDK